ncbi:MAG: hypothetical protein ACF8Q5_01285 [Phycisphaerales bacterium JB040]
MKIRLSQGLALAVTAALSHTALAQDCVEGSGLCDTDYDGPFIDGDPTGPGAGDPEDPGDPGDPGGPGPLLRWSPFNIDAAQDRNLIDHFGSTVVVRRFGAAQAWGDTTAYAGDTFAPDARLPGVESADFHTLAARADSPTDNYAVMLRWDTGAMTSNDVLTLGQLFRDSATALTSARIQASYQGNAVALSNFDLFNLDLATLAGIDVSADLATDSLTGALTPTLNGVNSDYLMLRLKEGVLVDKIDIFVDSTRPMSPYADRIDIGLGAFTVPTPTSGAALALGLLAGARRRR